MASSAFGPVKWPNGLDLREHSDSNVPDYVPWLWLVGVDQSGDLPQSLRTCGIKDRRAGVLHAISPGSAAIIYEYEINNVGLFAQPRTRRSEANLIYMHITYTHCCNYNANAATNAYNAGQKILPPISGLPRT
ncbi:hypothetical protein M5D96_000683 [Drosophila gunungcola]|uniref:Uncharacterized protein n=1 Tax=Drosophila gunungcola TaxID=103775 RepID=A0A9P9YWN3_9MUSC|nr:hypothetical protein M5D96_000683 [Drosophila gunungcola]